MTIAVTSAATSDTLVEGVSPASELSTLSGDEALQAARGAGASASGSKAKSALGADGEKGTYCHHCHRRVDSAAVTRCANVKTIGKQTKACGRVYCHKDLKARYGYKDGQEDQLKGGKCPCCVGACMESACRKRRGDLSAATIPILTPTKAASAATPRKSSTSTPAAPSTSVKAKSKTTPLAPSHAQNHPLAKSAQGGKLKGTKRDSSAFDRDPALDASDSELSDLDETEIVAIGNKGKGKGDNKDKKAAKAENVKPQAKKARLSVVLPSASSAIKGKGKAAASTPTKTAKGTKADKADKGKKPRASAASADGKKPTKGKEAATPTKKPTKAKGEPVKGTPKAKAKAQASGTPKAKATPKPKAPPVPRPHFEKIDTDLSRGDVEYRIQLREYLYRFHETLSIPPRLLPAVDDFDRPLTEASVKLFAGAMLDVFKDEFAEDDEDEDVVEIHNRLFKHREELRFYGDLARFAQIYHALSDDLDFVLPPAAPSLKANTTDLGTKRNASRLPSPDEVVRMLVAMAERTLESPIIHDELDANTGEADARREHAREMKAEGVRWEAEKKKMSTAQLKAKGAAEGKQIKERIQAASKEHASRVTTLDANLRATLARYAPRYPGPLGTDKEGRVYYLLTPRVVEDYGRPPVGWASGLVCWGKGGAKSSSTSAMASSQKARKSNGPTGQEDLLAGTESDDINVERWSHFGSSAHAGQLVKWLEATKCEDELVASVRQAQEWLEVLEYKGQGEIEP